MKIKLTLILTAVLAFTAAATASNENALSPESICMTHEYPPRAIPKET